MKPSSLGAFIGGLAGFTGILAWKMLVVTVGIVRALLFPGSIFLKYSQGMSPFGQMIFDTLAYLLDLALYAAVGYAVGRWLSGKPSQTTEKET